MPDDSSTPASGGGKLWIAGLVALCAILIGGAVFLAIYYGVKSAAPSAGAAAADSAKNEANKEDPDDKQIRELQEQLDQKRAKRAGKHGDAGAKMASSGDRQQMLRQLLGIVVPRLDGDSAALTRIQQGSEASTENLAKALEWAKNNPDAAREVGRAYFNALVTTPSR